MLIILALIHYITIKDVLLRLNLNVTNCRGQCYDGASNMVGIRSGVATMILKEEPRAILTHCYGHSLQLAVCDTVKQIKVMQDALDTTNEISKLLKYSPKRDTLFAKLKNELAPDTPGFRVLCPTRWTVRAASLQSVLDNWKPLQELWEESLDTKLDPEIKSRIIGVKYQMETFNYFFGVSLGALIFGHSDNLSKTLQHTYISAVEGQSIAQMSIQTLQKLRSESQFDLFWLKINRNATELDIPEPSLPRKRKRPSRFESGNAPPEFPESPKLHYRQLYFNSLDIVIACIKARFDQPGYSIYSKMESVLLKAANNQEFLEELNTVSKFYNNDIDCRLLKIQLQTLSTHFQNTSTPVNSDPHRPKNDFKDLKHFLINLTSAQRQLFSEVVFYLR